VGKALSERQDGYTDVVQPSAPSPDISVSQTHDVRKVALPAEPLREAVRRFEARVIRETIQRAGSKRKAAELLGVDIATIVRKSRFAEN
jgi:transcriptional regulator with PAS, ATPase and Fis domain